LIANLTVFFFPLALDALLSAQVHGLDVAAYMRAQHDDTKKTTVGARLL
jgi:hypothetical protein